REHWGPLTYFCWLELQRRGAVHYHAIVLNPPRRSEGFNWKWLENEWGLGFIHVRGIPGHTWRAQRLEHVRKYAKKQSHKRHQQEYDTVPSSIRTFMTNRLERSLADLDAHRSHWLVRYVPEEVYLGEWRPAAIELVAQLVHTPLRASAGARPPPTYRWCSLSI